MGASGGLSNHDLPALLHSLSGGQTRTASRAAVSGGYPDGRRAFGTVGAAVVEVLSTGAAMKASEIHAAVCALLDGQVSRHSVGDFLRVRAVGRRPLFSRVRHGYYVLLAEADRGRV